MAVTAPVPPSAHPGGEDHPVLPTQVHKRDPSAVLLRRWRRDGDRFTIPGGWAEGGTYVAHADGAPSATSAAEAVRQASILVSHVGFDVPRDAAFVMSRLDVTWPAGDAPAPRAFTMVLDATEVVRDDAGALVSMTTLVELLDEGDRPFAGGLGALRILPAPVYERIRPSTEPVSWSSDHPRVDAATAGCARADDVLIGPGPAPGSWTLVVDTTHPTHFDHPSDHVPGMLLIEACRQAHTAAGAGPVTSLTCGFSRYVEFAPATTIVPVDDGAQGRVLEVVQRDAVVARVVLGG